VDGPVKPAESSPPAVESTPTIEQAFRGLQEAVDEELSTLVVALYTEGWTATPREPEPAGIEALFWSATGALRHGPADEQCAALHAVVLGCLRLEAGLQAMLLTHETEEQS
jgi:hypothetical protein